MTAPKDKRLHRGRGRRRAALGHDHRHRRLGLAAQADVGRAGDPAPRPHRPHRRQLGRARRRHPLRRRQGEAPRLRLRVPRLDPARAPLPRRPPGGRHRGRALRRGHVPPRPPGRRLAGAVPPHPRRPRLRHPPGQRPRADGDLALRRRRGAGGRARPHDGRRLRPHERGRRPRQRACTSAPTPTWTTCSSAPPQQRYLSTERDRAHRGAGRRGPTPGAAHQPAARRRRDRGAQRRPLHLVRPGLRPRRGVPEGVRGVGQDTRGVGRASGARGST